MAKGREAHEARLALLCERCARAIEDLKPLPPGDSWRVLAKTVWSEVPAVQALALRLLKRQAETEAWARETLETVFVDAEVEALAAEEA